MSCYHEQNEKSLYIALCSLRQIFSEMAKNYEQVVKENMKLRRKIWEFEDDRRRTERHLSLLPPQDGTGGPPLRGEDPACGSGETPPAEA